MCLYTLNEGICEIRSFGFKYFMIILGWFIIGFVSHVFMYVKDAT